MDGLTRRDATGIYPRSRRRFGGCPDPTILEWAAAHGLVLLTHDRKTIPPFAYARVTAGLPMPAFFSSATTCRSARPLRNCSSPLDCLAPEECKDIVKYFPK